MLGNGLQVCENLNELDLSFNELGDEGMEVLAASFGYNASIKKLILSNNDLTHQSGFYLAEAMEDLSIQHLDLSWNQISEEQGLKKFLSTAAEHNESILKIDLSWNALTGDKIATILKNFIAQHRTLQELNLSHNRFETASESIKIAKGTNASESLRVLDLSYNGLNADSAFSLLSAIQASKTKLRSLRLDNVWVKPEFDKLRQNLKTQCGLEVVVEGVSGGADIIRPDMQIQLLKRAHYLGYKPKKKKKDFGWFLLRLQKAGTLVPVKKAKFEILVQEDKIKFDDGMIDEFAKRFRDENKKIDLNLMLQKYLALYPNTVLLEKKKKKIKQPKDKNKSPADKEDLKEIHQADKEDLKEIDQADREDLKEIDQPDKEDLKEIHQADKEDLTEIDQADKEDLKEIDQPDKEDLKEIHQADKEDLAEIEQTDKEDLKTIDQADKEDLKEIDQADKEDFKEIHQADKEDFTEILQADKEDLKETHQADRGKSSLTQLEHGSEKELKLSGRKSSTGLKFDASSKRKSMSDKGRGSFKIEPLTSERSKTSRQGSKRSQQYEML